MLVDEVGVEALVLSLGTELELYRIPEDETSRVFLFQDPTPPSTGRNVLKGVPTGLVPEP